MGGNQQDAVIDPVACMVFWRPEPDAVVSGGGGSLCHQIPTPAADAKVATPHTQ
jgi:hypothetical protein